MNEPEDGRTDGCVSGAGGWLAVRMPAWGVWRDRGLQLEGIAHFSRLKQNPKNTGPTAIKVQPPSLSC